MQARVQQVIASNIGVSPPKQATGSYHAPDVRADESELRQPPSGKHDVQIRDQKISETFQRGNTSFTARDTPKRRKVRRGLQRQALSLSPGRSPHTPYRAPEIPIGPVETYKLVGGRQLRFENPNCPPHVLWERYLPRFSRRGVDLSENTSELGRFVCKVAQTCAGPYKP